MNDERLLPHRSSFCVHRSLRLAPLVLVHVVTDAEARAGGGVHLLRGVDCVLQLGDAVFHLRQLLFDLILELADFLLRHLKRGLIELPLLIAEDRHRSHPPNQNRRSDHSLKSTLTVVHDFTRTPSFIPAAKRERRMVCCAASLMPTGRFTPLMTLVSST